MLIAKHCVFGAAFFLKKGRFWCRFLLIFKIGERIIFGGAFSYSLKKGRFWYCFLLIFKKGKKGCFWCRFFEKAAL
jgi:hypothetical protein